MHRLQHTRRKGERSNIRSCANRFIEWTVEIGFSEYTASIRSQALKRFAEWCRRLGISHPAQLTPRVIEEYQLHLGRYRTARGQLLMATTQATRLNPVKAFCKWLVRQRLVSGDPAATLTLPRLPRRLPSYVPTEAEVQRVLAVPDVATTAGVRDRAMLEVLYSCAIRRLELSALKLGDFQPDRGVIWIRDGKGGKDRIVPIGFGASRWLNHYINGGRNRLANQSSGDTLFLTDSGEPFVKNRLGDLVKRYLRKAGIRGRGSCHLFRHACATHMLENGADVRFIQEMLGHSDLSTTQVYTRVSIVKLKEVHARCHPDGAQRFTATNSADNLVDPQSTGINRK